MTIIQLPRTKESFQQPVPEYELIKALTDQLQSEKIIDVSELSSGLFNSTYKISTTLRQLILKVAPHQSADVFFNERHLMQREQTLSQQLRLVSNLIPNYISFFKIGDRDAFIQEYVDGELWFDVLEKLSSADNDTLWRQLGQFANSIHQVSSESYGYPTPHIHYHSWYEFIHANVAGMMDDCVRLQIVTDEMKQYQALLPRHQQRLNEITEAKLCHGDLWPRNVIINNSQDGYEISAVIDAERAFWGDPISDWVLLLYDVPTSFWDGYGTNLLDVTDPKRLAIYRGMYFILNILESTRFPESIDHYLEQLNKINKILK